LLLLSAVSGGSSFGGEELPEGSFFLENLETLTISNRYRLPEIVLGRDDAPNTVILYSSFTCSHCKQFHDKELPKFKKEYVDTGEAKIYLRCYLEDLGSFESAALIRCLGGSSVAKIEELCNKVFGRQEEWMESEDPPQFLRNIFVKSGYKKEAIEACIRNKEITAGLIKEQQRAVFEHKVLVLPAFIVNGTLHNGKLTCEKLAAMLKKNEKGRK
jgi:protein-disulfide isomerase